MPSGPFKPAFGGKLLPVGCSDKTPRSHYGNERTNSELPKFTTYSRTTAAIEQYWRDRAADAAAASPALASGALRSQRQPGGSLPGGETSLAHKSREACWRDSVQLGHQPERYIPTCQGTPADIEEKEVIRTRGITGFTGKQPPPGLSKPPPTVPDTSGWVAINAFDERRPRVKGIPGYTGHQPPSPEKTAAAAAAVAGNSSSSDQIFDHSTHTWIQIPSSAQSTTATAAAAAQSPAAACQHAQQYIKQHHPLGHGQAAAAGPTASAAAATVASRSNVTSAGSSGSSQSGVLQAGQYQPWSGATAASASEASSTPYSPRFFMNGEELAADCVPVPASAQSRCQGLCQTGTAGVLGLAAAADCAGAASGSSEVNAVCGSCGCCCQQQSGGQYSRSCHVLCSNRQPLAAAAAAAGAAWNAQYGAVVATAGRPASAFSGLRRTRQTTYSSAYAPAAGFGQLLQQQMKATAAHR